MFWRAERAAPTIWPDVLPSGSAFHGKKRLQKVEVAW